MLAATTSSTNIYTLSSSIAVITGTCGLVGALITGIITYIFVKNQLARQNDILNARTIQAYKDNKEAQDLLIQDLNTRLKAMEEKMRMREEISDKAIADLKKRIGDLEGENARLVKQFSLEPYQNLDRRMGEFEIKYDKIFESITANQKTYLDSMPAQTKLIEGLSSFLEQNLNMLILIKGKLEKEEAKGKGHKKKPVAN